MSTKKHLIALSAVLLATVAQAQFTDVINSNRPGESFSAFSVGKTVIQAEFGIGGVKEEHDLLKYESKGINTELVMRYGAFLDQLEFIGELQYQYDKFSSPTASYDRSGFKQATIGAKYLVYDPNKKYIDRKPNLFSWKANNEFKWRTLIPAVGVYVGGNVKLSDEFPPSNQPGFSGKAMVITQNQLGRYVLVSNIIADRFGSIHETFAYIVTLTYGINERWSAFIENQGIQSDHYGDLIFRGGAAYLLAENIQIDASAGISAKNTPSLLTAGIGLSWRFDANYEDVLIRLPGEEKSDKKDKKDKKKKRKDEIPSEEPAP